MEGVEFAQNTRVPTVLNRREIVGVEFREERIGDSQVWKMDPQMFFENVASSANGLETFARRVAAAVVSSQIWQRLFAFEDCCRPNTATLRAIRRHIGAIAALRQTHFHGAGGITLRLCPKKREALQMAVGGGFAAAARYS